MCKIIYKIQGTCCVVYATMHSIQYESGWVYTGCKQCNTKVTPIAANSGMNSRNKKQYFQTSGLSIFKQYSNGLLKILTFRVFRNLF